jgi:hypothetical protein
VRRRKRVDVVVVGGIYQVVVPKLAGPAAIFFFLLALHDLG